MAWPGEPMKAPTDETMITRPRWRRSILARARLVTRNAPDRLVSMTSDQASSLIRSTRRSRVIPALATRTSTGPHAASTAVNAASTWAGSVTSQTRDRNRSARRQHRRRPRPAPDREVTATLVAAGQEPLRRRPARSRGSPPVIISTIRRRVGPSAPGRPVTTVLAGGPDPGHRLTLDHPFAADAPATAPGCRRTGSASSVTSCLPRSVPTAGPRPPGRGARIVAAAAPGGREWPRPGPCSPARQVGRRVRRRQAWGSR